MDRKKLMAKEIESDAYINDNMVGNEMCVTIDVEGARLKIDAASGDRLLAAWDLAKIILEGEKHDKVISKKGK